MSRNPLEEGFLDLLPSDLPCPGAGREALTSSPPRGRIGLEDGLSSNRASTDRFRPGRDGDVVAPESSALERATQVSPRIAATLRFYTGWMRFIHAEIRRSVKPSVTGASR